MPTLDVAGYPPAGEDMPWLAGWAGWEGCAELWPCDWVFCP